MISKQLQEMEQLLWQYEFDGGGPLGYDLITFRAITKIFMSGIIDKMWDLQEKENIDMDIRSDMALKAGDDIRNLIRKYTGIDTHELYK
jgi:hypothetical protein